MAGQIERCGVTGLIQAHAAASGQTNSGRDAPSGMTNPGGLRALQFERHDGCAQIVTHQVDLCVGEILIRVMLDEVAWMNAEFGRRQREDQPAFACVDGGKSEHVAKKSAIRFRIATVEEKMCAEDHGRDSTPAR